MLKRFFYLGFFSNKYCYSASGLIYRNSGWTLLEIMVVCTIMGILASLAIPNILGIMEKNKAQNSLYRVKGALQEAQRNAIRMGKECRISINTIANGGSNHSITLADSSYAGCLSQEVVLDKLTMIENFPGTTIRFSYKGNTTNLGTIVIESTNANERYCLVSSNFLGIMRSGIYNRTTTGGVSATYCKSSI